MARLWLRAGGTRQDKRNTLAMRTGEDKDYIHMRRDDTGGNNQGLGETPDR